MICFLKNDCISYLGFLGLRLGFSFLRFLGLGLGLRLNKMDFVCMSWVLYEILNHTCLTYMYKFCIIFCVVLHTWLHTKILYEGLDSVFALHNLQTPSFKLSQIIFAPLQNSFWCLHNVNFCHNNYIVHIWPCINIKFWRNMKNYVYYHRSKFQLI
jgi:hypothetical protein